MNERVLVVPEVLCCDRHTGSGIIDVFDEVSDCMSFSEVLGGSKGSFSLSSSNCYLIFLTSITRY